jgi:L-fuconolactonase
VGTAVKVDAHHHLWDVATREHSWLDGPATAQIRKTFAVADLETVARAAGIERTVLVQVLASVDETREFLALAERSALIAGVVGWVDLTGPEVADQLAGLPGLVGIRHLVQGEPDPGWLSRPEVRRGLRAVGEAGLCFDLLTLPHQLPAAIDTVRALPELTFVLDHLSKPPIASGQLEPWNGLLRELAAEPNVVAKLSGLVTEAGPAWDPAALRPYVDVALEAFGPRRLMFGSDWPVCLLAAGYTEWADVAAGLIAELSPREREEIFGGTASRVYSLDKR